MTEDRIGSLLSRWPLAAAAASAAMLAAAHAFETLGGLAPCALCYQQREVYWAALALGVTGYIAAKLRPHWPVPRLASAGLALVFLYGAGLAAYHAGVEWKWWPGPALCSGGAAVVDPSAMAALLRGESVSPPSCDTAAWVWMGLSMAGWNAVASAALTIVSIVAAFRRPRHG